MVTRNVHAHATKGVGQGLCLLLSYVPPLLALALILVIVCPHFSYFTLGVLAQRRHDSLLEMVMFLYSLCGCTVCWTLLLWSFFATILTPPGYVDGSWRQPPPAGTVELNCDGQPRYCRKCQLYKPDRAHHCSECEKCVLAMDHHCPWVNNCIGERNQRRFTLFLVYIPVAATHMVGTVLLTYFWIPHTQPLSATDLLHSLFIFLSTVGAGIVGVVLGGFAAFQCFLISEETSTIDRKFGAKHRREAGRLRCRMRFEALKLVMGPDWRWWWLPSLDVARSRSVDVVV
jgi:hypothetical protein